MSKREDRRHVLSFGDLCIQLQITQEPTPSKTEAIVESEGERASFAVLPPFRGICRLDPAQPRYLKECHLVPLIRSADSRQ